MDTPRQSPLPLQTSQSNHTRANQSPISSKEEIHTRPPSPKQVVSTQDFAAQLPVEWRAWPEMTILLDGLPPDVTTNDIWNWFSEEGEISYIDIYESRGLHRPRSGKVRFEPPPKRAFWVLNQGKYRVPHSNSQHSSSGSLISVAPATYVPTSWIRSPVSRDRIHPIKITVQPKSILFGTLTDATSLKVLGTIPSIEASDGPRLEINLKLKRLTVFFPIKVKGDDHDYVRRCKILIEFHIMKRILQKTDQNNDCTLVLPLQIPPSYYWQSRDVTKTLSHGVENWNSTEAWNRATDLLYEFQRPRDHPVSLHTDYQDPSHIDIGRWTTLGFVLSGGSEKAKQLNHQMKIALEDFNIATEIHDDFKITPGEQAVMWKLIDHPPAVKVGGARALLELSSVHITQLAFEVRYQLEVCISRGILNEYNITIEFIQKLAHMEPFKARLRLEYLADQNELLQNPMALFNSPDADAYFPNHRIPHYCALVRKVSITPTTIRFNTPAVETSNRVMRRYNHIQDRFLRVQFVGESEKSRITVNKDQNEDIWIRILRTLFQGIRIGDRKFEFLAFGSSQLRQCGAYFFCPTEHVSCDDIRNWMGQFDHIKIIAKYAARLGQCFSTTREIRGISVPKIRPIKDIERNGHCFTDGVGKMSPFVSQMIIQEMMLDVFDQPSAFQFRMGGCKGVLAVWPSAIGTEVHIRESQEKFKADFNGLEIIRCAKFATATLNRQTITILESLGVPVSAFLDLLYLQLKSFEKAMEDNNTAMELLTRFVDENQTTLIIAEMLRAGFKTEAIHEPFVVNVLSLWRSWCLKLLKDKARIQVEKSAFVLGCVDETGTLRGHSARTEGSKEKDVNKLPQIFLQITDSKHYNKTHIIKGVCIVGRNPSLHPGDIRVVQAVDNPKLHHLKDVVVFPSKGDKPVPSMLSGGDLDGDDFFVIWDKTLMPKIWNYRPMNYTAPKPKELNADVVVEDLKNFFVQYMQNDKLPLIAISHLAFADSLGPMSPKCLELANLHSKAVDYPKTGESATMRRDLNPRRFPHFMEKRNSYQSRKALGIIYDKVVTQTVEFKPIWDSPFDERITKRYKLNNEVLKAARKIKTQYDTAVRRILSQHDLGTEFELWTTFALTKAAIGSDYKRQEDLGHEYDTLKHRFRDMCYEVVGTKQGEQLDRFVAAMYIITEEEVKIALYEHHRGPINEAGEILQPRRLEARSMPLISFPWIFHWVLIRIALGGQYDPKDSLLAAAHKNVNHVQPPPSNGLGISRSGGGQETDADEARPINVGLDAHATQLPDGTVIHRGQLLALFGADDEEPTETFSDPGEDKPLPTSSNEEQDKINTDTDSDSDGTAKDVGGSAVEPLANDTEACEREVQESAMDRLARLTECGEED